MIVQEGLTTEDNVKLRLQELEVLDEKRLEAQQALECYQVRMSKAFDKHVKPRSFHVGDLVLTFHLQVSPNKMTMVNLCLFPSKKTMMVQLCFYLSKKTTMVQLCLRLFKMKMVQFRLFRMTTKQSRDARSFLLEVESYDKSPIFPSRNQIIDGKIE
ncbi:uncharacterized protein E5676_scaffold21G002070 [Cucumis melo var. makuwa]|uniref:Uncharacterized protein n=1 Tax=Cucumis melo var. makuwa TaxID=1194695 RepID=A0A5D3CXY4_CUCMM|nr:uncharacterized protein E5676_scaffold21G002070 [Cucumis melo var. makuwa]